MVKKLFETTNLGLEIMNSKQDVKRKLGHVQTTSSAHFSS